MSAVSQKPITADEFFRLPEPLSGARQELVRGMVVTMPPAGGLHGVCCLKTGRKIANHVDSMPHPGTVTSNDAGFITARDPDSVRGPDIAYWSKERLPEVPLGYFEIAPDLAVEVLSPSNTSKQIRTKLAEYFERGVHAVWVVAPEDRTVTVYRSADEGRVLHESAVLTGDDVLPGFTCRVSELLP